MKFRWNTMNHTVIICLIIIFAGAGSPSCTSRRNATTPEESLIAKPKHGFVSLRKATKWEEFLITGNGTLGAMMSGDPYSERIILSHEKLFMPEYPPTEAPDLGSNLEQIRELVMDGRGQEASKLAVELGVESGIEEMVWTDPLVPACQLEIESLNEEMIQNFTRGINYESGEAIAAWQTAKGQYKRKVFVSRADELIVMSMETSGNARFNLRLRLASLPMDDKALNEDNQEFSANNLIDDINTGISGNGKLTYTTIFKKQWDGSLKGFLVEAMVTSEDGIMDQERDWLTIKEAKSIQIKARIVLSYALPLPLNSGIDQFDKSSYEQLLSPHEQIHSEMFNRFSVQLKDGNDDYYAEDLLKSSAVGNLNNQLVNQLCEASRYLLISSSGKLPPTLQGIWGGTWRPAWSGDFTLNGNVPSAIASGLNTNFREVIEAYMDYMFTMRKDFHDNARDLYGAPGLFVPSRTSSSGKTYHFAEPYPHLFWYAGGAWTSQIFFDYWQYTGDDQDLRDRIIPFMLASAEFYKYILVKDKNDKYHFIPSYSPEVGPLGHHPVVKNATMDIAALRQLIRNLFYLEELGYLNVPEREVWKDILDNLPGYEIDDTGDLKEWIWPGLNNDNSHRHASHLYPLFYEVDPAFEERPELKAAARTAIEKRLEYRREKNGAEMAFGLVQKGLAAAHIKDTEHAYECVDWLCNSYWSPAFTSYHDPGEIFNVDICGGLPALVTEMIIQSSADELLLLPVLPAGWHTGEIRGVGTRCGVTVDLVWRDGEPVSVMFKAHKNTSFTLRFGDSEWEMQMKKGDESTLEI